MQRVTVRLDPLTSVAAYDELCDVVMREYPEDRWLVALGDWDLEGRTCVVAADNAREVATAFERWCAEMGLGAPTMETRDLSPAERAALERDLGASREADDD